MLKFKFDEKKGLEALTYVAQQWPDVTAFYASKVIFFAEKEHLNRYARPIIGDTFIAMTNGPVPSTIYNFIEGNLDQAEDPESIVDALSITHDRYSKVSARRDPDLDFLSESDIECLSNAIKFCRGKGFGNLSHISHQERAWREASTNAPMDYEAMIDAENGEEVIEDAREFAAYGVM